MTKGPDEEALTLDDKHNHPMTGRLEDWKTGRLEDWKTGRLEDWKTGRLEDWSSSKNIIIIWSKETY